MNEVVKDQYDQAMENLRRLLPAAFSMAIARAWGSPRTQNNGCLFKFPNVPNAREYQDPVYVPLGCLTMIRKDFVEGETISPYGIPGYPDLTEEIRRDDRIPTEPSLITTESLDAFAEWQRRMDKEVRP